MQIFYFCKVKYYLFILLILGVITSFSQGNALNLDWEYYGPYNISGRAGQLLIDKDDPNLFFLASKVGGLFKSEDGGANWDIIDTYQGHSTVTSLAQASDGTIFLGTGEFFNFIQTSLNSGRIGNGLWRSSNGGDTWENLSSTSSFLEEYPFVANYNAFPWRFLNEIKSLPLNQNILLVANRSRIAISENALDAAQEVQFNPITGASNLSGEGQSIDIASDGSVAFATISGRTFRSLDFQNNFKTGWELMDSVGFGQRATVRVAPSNPNVVYVAVVSAGCMRGVYRSLDKGDTWEQIVEGGAPYDNDPFNDPLAPVGSCAGFGWHHQDMVIHPTDENIALIGSFTLHKWNGNDETFTQIDLTETEVNTPNNPKFLPKGKHRLTFNDTGNILYISTDRGVYKSMTINETDVSDIHFEAMNNNLNTINLYGMGVGISGEALVGTHSNGNILMCSEELPPPIVGNIIIEGEGGYAQISHFNPDFLFFSQSFGALKRSTDRGETYDDFLDINIGKGCGVLTCNLDLAGNCPEGGSAGFITVSELMETKNKSIQQATAFLYSPTDTLNPGQHLAQSANVPVEFEVTLNNTLFPGDTAFFDDPYDAKYFVSSLSCGIWMCANPLSVDQPIFYRLTQGGNPQSYDYSLDGNHLFWVVGGTIGIISGFNELELDGNGSTIPLINQPGVSLTLKSIQIPGMSMLEGISVDKNNSNHLLVVSGGEGTFNKVWRITDALSNEPVVEEIQNNLPPIPLYDCVIDIQNSDNYIIGSDFGIWASSDAGETWFYENNGLNNAYPIYQLKQVQLFEEDCPVLYAGIHGRGVARSLSLTPGFCDTQPECIEVFKKGSNLNITDFIVYPNPTPNSVQIEFFEHIEGVFEVNIFSVMGMQVFSQTYNNASSVDINLSSLTPGSFYITVLSENYNFVPQTFIKE